MVRENRFQVSACVHIFGQPSQVAVYFEQCLFLWPSTINDENLFVVSVSLFETKPNADWNFILRRIMCFFFFCWKYFPGYMPLSVWLLVIFPYFAMFWRIESVDVRTIAKMFTFPYFPKKNGAPGRFTSWSASSSVSSRSPGMQVTVGFFRTCFGGRKG